MPITKAVTWFPDNKLLLRIFHPSSLHTNIFILNFSFLFPLFKALACFGEPGTPSSGLQSKFTQKPVLVYRAWLFCVCLIREQSSQVLIVYLLAAVQTGLFIATIMEAVNPEMQAARDKLRAKFGDSARLGGKGGARIKKRPIVHKSGTGDDKKLQAAIKRMGLTTLPGVDEVAMIKNNGKALVFHHPKVQAAVNANTFIITGSSSDEKNVDQLSVVPEFDPEMLKRFAAEWQKMQNADKSQQSASPAAGEDEDEDDDDDDVPVLEEDFDTVAESK